jgi:hypothetical protein
MSRAFVKDANETFDELPDRPISPHPNIVTPEGLAAIEAAFDPVAARACTCAGIERRSALLDFTQSVGPGSW